MILTLTHSISSPTDLICLSIVVPCFNEADGLDQLSERLKTLKQTFSDRLEIEVLCVDDGSTDQTCSGLKSRFEHLDWVRIVQHSSNLGITASIMTGIKHASHELVATMDADCTYDPLQVMSLVELMTDDVAMVTASPYHPQGEVVGVPKWRLGLSRMASTCYGLLLGTSLHTYTCCFRIHRKSWMTRLAIRETGFVGVAEMLWQVQSEGGKIVEAPARLTSRRIGFSKMRTLPVIVGHLKLMSRILVTRFRKPRVTTQTNDS
jgi:dolichol-phosphate mannosyltransferase